MRRERKVQLLTAGLLLAVLGTAVARRSASSVQDPQSAVYALIDAERAGNVPAYLALHSGAMQAELRQVAAESGAAAFGRYLRDSHAAIKGVAVSDPRVADSSATVRVEYVFQDRNQAQVVYLEKTSGSWKVVRVESDQSMQALIPYGTPVR